jgi:Membrane carboxypeptidase/penicillin-binding protein
MNKNIKTTKTTGKKKTKKTPKKYTKYIIRFIWISFAVIILSITAFFALIANGKIGYMPPVEDLENPINKYASEVFTVDLQLMGTYAQSKDNRIYTNYNELSPYLVQALIATEDERFAKHSGIDAYALVRAVIKTGILFQKSGGGGSTITQQLAKQLYSDHAQSKMERVFQKPIEWVIAVQLERYYTKQEIINMYLNQFDFLYNAVGIQSACWVYFGKQPMDLTVEEAATLIGMCKNPSYFNPLRRVEQTVGRRNVVLDQMCNNGYISKAECDSVKQLPLVTHYHKADHKEGIAPYMREYIRLTMTAKKPEKKDYQSYQMQKFREDSLAWDTNPLYGWCEKNKKNDGSNYSLYTDGLKIYTTVDSRMQRYAEEAVEEHMTGYLQPAFDREKARAKRLFSRDISQKDIDQIMNRSMKMSDRYYNLKNRENKTDDEIEAIFNTPIEMQVYSISGPKDTIMTPIDSILYMKSFLRTGMMAMDSHTGAVKAYVGGTDFRYFQYDMVSMGKRQVGSTAKPFLYSLAMESGMTPCDEMLFGPQVLEDENKREWKPKNSNKDSQKYIGEMVSIRWGLQRSDNWVTAALMKRLSPYRFADLVYSYGILTPIAPVVSACLGPFDASVSEMVTAYSTYANGGIRIEPLLVTRIEDREGNIIATFGTRVQEIISESASYKMLSMLRGVVDGGTGNRMRRNHGMTVQMGGKTGTSQNHSDAWFMAFTPSLVGGCWVGGEERSIRFNAMAEGQGAASALPIMGIFMKKVYGDSQLGYSQSETFVVPEQYSNVCPTVSAISLDYDHDYDYSGAAIDEEFQ